MDIINLDNLDFLGFVKNKIKQRLLLAPNNKLTTEQKVVLEARESLNKPTSVMFFTTHKCASTFISALFQTLTRDSEYELKDYDVAVRLLGNKLSGKLAIGQEREHFFCVRDFLGEAADRLFFKRGDIYAPLRVPVDFPERSQFKHIFFLRDPRDVLVSSYYSFGFTHSLPKNSKARERVLKNRQSIQQQGIDNYAVNYATHWLVPIYSKYKEILETSESYIYLKYDDFQKNTVDFIDKIVSYINIPISELEIQNIANEACPVQVSIDNTKHQRSGKSQQYLKELKPETLEALNKIFSDILYYWDFKH